MNKPKGKTTQNYIDDLKKMRDGDFAHSDNKCFKNYIEYIRFPFYRNIKKDTKITFDFPITVFVGQNGCGKSSTLQAVFGSPVGYSSGNYWFSTNIDPIPKTEDKPCLIYGYRSNDEILEVLKTRVGSSKGADYWEPSRPLVKYEMKLITDGGRNEGVKRKIIYLDFRAELSAFDHYFYFCEPHRKTDKIKTTQDFLRSHSNDLKSIFNGSKFYIQRYSRKIKQNEPLIKINQASLCDISYILEKTYTEAKMVKHKFFQEWGYSILFKTNNAEYSEANAGSGETAVVRLVYELSKAEDYSLILLDEPEVSLHPAAQIRLFEYIAKMTVAKKLQVVISTHSQFFINDLPDEAIKVFYQDDDKFNVSNSNNKNEAFYYIGQPITDKRTLIVEDELSSQLIQNVIKSMGHGVEESFRVKYLSGGAESIIKSIGTYCMENDKNKYILLDGDKKHSDVNVDQITLEQQNVEYLEIMIKKVTYVEPKKINLHFNSNDNLKSEKYISFLKYYENHVFYLPKLTPEEIIWDDDYANSQLNGSGADQSVIKSIQETSDFKLKFEILCNNINTYNNSNAIMNIQGMFLKKWLNLNKSNEAADYIAIKEIIKKIQSSQ